MKTWWMLSLFLLNLSALVLISGQVPETHEEVCIVYMGAPLPKASTSASIHHLNILKNVKGSKAEASHLRSFERSFNGFIAKLTKAEVAKISEMEGVISVFRSETRPALTTRSWDFLGEIPTIQRSQNASDIIVGMIDYGIWPESQSFNDSNIGPPPSKWKGTCQAAANFSCNNKIIGARYYLYNNPTPWDSISPRDTWGHGTHTASIVAGNFVDGASFQGLGFGIARGGVPSTRLAIYKACWTPYCLDANVLAAFEDAIADGVDIISVSVAFDIKYYFQDVIAIGAFHAHQNGILTVAAAGNGGPELQSILNFAPWLLSVGASSIDRDFVTILKLGDTETIEGASANTFANQSLMYDIVQHTCKEQAVDSTLVRGKLVFCLDEIPNNTSAGDVIAEIGVLLKSAGAVGAIIQYNDTREIIFAFPIPAIFLTFDNVARTKRYLNSTSQPSGLILRTIQQEDGSAPVLANFSSRGPNPYTVNILKPDLTAPGVNILAAWPNAAATPAQGDDRIITFNFHSGTSMACPHVSAVAAYIKSVHPTWSPSAIMSAMLTTATPVTNGGANHVAEFGYGAGQISPLDSLNPGLVYELDSADFLQALCGEGYGTKYLQLITGDNRTCTPGFSKSISDLNYPSFAVFAPKNTWVSESLSRNVTNVGSPTSIYEVTIDAPTGFVIQVEPSTLSFQTLGESQCFKVLLSGNMTTNDIVSGSLTWSDGTNRVRSPFVVHSIPPVAVPDSA